jgi:hypothetical protein
LSVFPRASLPERKATNRPSALIVGSTPEASEPSLATLTRVVSAVSRSCTNTSATPFPSSFTRSDSESNAT